MAARPRSGHEHRAKRSLGQNFLVDPNLQRTIAEAIHPEPDDDVLEIGPGLGALTQHLAGRVRHLLLVELDDRLVARLRDHYRDLASVTVIHQDILETDIDTLVDEPERLKVIGNIPYNITSPIIFHLLERARRPREIVLMIQKEVADRILSEPGGRSYGALAVGVQAVARVERLLNVGRGAFRPAPDVDSSVIRITPHHPPLTGPSTEGALRTLTRLAFGKRRKQFQRILRDGLHLAPDRVEELERDTGFDLRARPETFSPLEFIRLAEALRSHGDLPA